MELDIRNKSDEIDTIRFYDDEKEGCYCAVTLDKREYDTFSGFSITSGNGSRAFIINEEQTRNLIAALEKALDLGWVH